MNFLPATRAALACHALPLHAPMQSRFSRAANTTESIAAPAMFYWARGLKSIGSSDAVSRSNLVWYEA
jgi:hypothetical protein